MTSGVDDSKRGRSGAAWALAAGALYVLAMLGIGFGIGESSAERGWVEWIGRFHFLMLHLPIGMLLLAIAIEIGAMVLKSVRPARAAVPFTLWMAACGAVAATVCGLMLSKSGGYGEVLLERHLWTGTGVAVGTFLTLAVRLVGDSRGGAGLRAAYLTLLVATVGLLNVASHLGGTLTHGEGFLTKAMPNELRALIGMEVEEEVASSVGELALYEQVVTKVFEAKCTECHGETKQKGDYRMDSFDAVVAGGDTAPGVVPGDLDGSELWYRIITDDEDDIMPPDGKDALSPQEMLVVQWWIQSGAAQGKTVAELEPTEEVTAAIEEVMGLEGAG